MPGVLRLRVCVCGLEDAVGRQRFCWNLFLERFQGGGSVERGAPREVERFVHQPRQAVWAELLTTLENRGGLEPAFVIIGEALSWACPHLEQKGLQFFLLSAWPTPTTCTLACSACQFRLQGLPLTCGCDVDVHLSMSGYCCCRRYSTRFVNYVRSYQHGFSLQ